MGRILPLLFGLTPAQEPGAILVSQRGFSPRKWLPLIFFFHLRILVVNTRLALSPRTFIPQVLVPRDRDSAKIGVFQPEFRGIARNTNPRN